MTEFIAAMGSDLQDGDGTREKCKLRRIQMRRLSTTTTTGGGSVRGAAASSSSSSSSTRRHPNTSLSNPIKTAQQTGAKNSFPPTSSAGAGEEWPESEVVAEDGGDGDEPETGTMSVAGRSRAMEDALAVKTKLCRPEFYRGRTVHFFAVFDGHGGPTVAALCQEMMHVILRDELARVDLTNVNPFIGLARGRAEQRYLEGKWKGVMMRCFERMDEIALNVCACGSVGSLCGCHPVEGSLSGSTAVVAALSSDHIVVANCGDSRAVLCRGGRAVPLSVDQKPDRPDELARLRAAGGQVIFMNGARVEGILAMSRAIGDKFFKPAVISEPEVTFTRRDPEDECLILASDGLWDVLSNTMACQVACECLREENPCATTSGIGENGTAREPYPSRSVLAAALLTRLALGRRSEDNISVIVVDLKRS